MVTGRVTLTRFAIITLSPIKNDNKSDKELGDQIRKEIAASPRLKGWKVNKITILSD
jgi:hypothetical protein